MPKKVFVLGAGFNQFLRKQFDHPNLKIVENLGFNIDNVKIDSMSPPMSRNYFRYSLLRQFSSWQSIYGINNKVLNYIDKQFNRPRETLLTSEFDLELFFSVVESQIHDAKIRNEIPRLKYLEEIRLNLLISIGENFFDLEWRLPEDESGFLVKFGHIILKTKADVITFNYDCLAEWGIERASGKNKDALGEGDPYFNWDRYSAYGINFTKIRDGGWMGYWDAARGRNIAKKFYKKYYKQFPDSRFIKLHGSNNWFKYSEFKKSNLIKKVGFKKLAELGSLYIKSEGIPKSLKNELICFNGDWQFGVLPTWDHYRYNTRNQNVLEPVIIPPILTKENKLHESVFMDLWKQAKECLISCQEIVFIGYSFPATDFYSKKLFIETLCENRNISITVVNPDRSVINKLRDLVNYTKEIKYYSDSGDYISNYFKQ